MSFGAVRLSPTMSLTVELEDFLSAHRPHGHLQGDTGDLTPNGYRLAVACACGVTFHRWITPLEAVGDLGWLARQNLRLRAPATSPRPSASPGSSRARPSCSSSTAGMIAPAGSRDKPYVDAIGRANAAAPRVASYGRASSGGNLATTVASCITVAGKAREPEWRR
jgi:hypothetical protein